MNKIIEIKLESCKSCPYLEWEENIGCGNYSGWSKCKKENRCIERNTQFPEFPEWCPL